MRCFLAPPGIVVPWFTERLWTLAWVMPQHPHMVVLVQAAVVAAQEREPGLGQGIGRVRVPLTHALSTVTLPSQTAVSMPCTGHEATARASGAAGWC